MKVALRFDARGLRTSCVAMPLLASERKEVYEPHAKNDSSQHEVYIAINIGIRVRIKRVQPVGGALVDHFAIDARRDGSRQKFSIENSPMPMPVCSFDSVLEIVLDNAI